MRTVLVTGGAGFVGSALVRHLIRHTAHRVVTVDALTYAGNLRSLASVADDPRHTFEHVDVCDGGALTEVFRRHRPDAVMHLAAESHVDRSIDASAAFVRTNVVGTATLLDVVRDRLEGPDAVRRDDFRLIHVSTDEVYGDLPLDGPERFREDSPYDPHSPYAASKAASDHFVRAWSHTHGVPAIVTHSTNNYGPWQFPEKLIPVAVLRALAGEPIPIYGDGANVRDWIFVEDHARALTAVLERGVIGETYGIGARCRKTNLEVARAVCGLLDELAPDFPGAPHADLITFVDDRPGHDRRYATDPSKIERGLGWRPEVGWADGLRATVAWFVREEAWCRERLAAEADTLG
ncbi:MAG: dTDP-glucose 4,6-dehydratase [Longimicrobiales bacterium]